jgi:hypothetical protein
MRSRTGTSYRNYFRFQLFGILLAHIVREAILQASIATAGAEDNASHSRVDLSTLNAQTSL